MKGWNCFVWVVVAVALASGAPGVRAAGSGTISFTGMIAAPTCSPDLGSANLAPNRWHHCGESQPDAQKALKAPYVLTVSALGTSTLASDRLVAYMAEYLASAGHADGEAKLLTQAYE